jgi:hypothetical protein
MLFALAGAQAEPPIVLRDVTAQSGVSFRHTDGSSGRYYLIESVASGMATFDYDGDGLVDIYFLNGRPLPGATADREPTNALYRNLGGFRFADVTAEAGVGDPGFGLGVAVGDYDNDGYPDLYCNNFGLNVCYRNGGDGTFADATQQTGTARGETAGAGANFLDMDADGDLDLFVSNYVRFSFEVQQQRFIMGMRRYPAPRFHQQQSNTLFRNEGAETFSDVTRESGIGDHVGPGMGTVSLDFDNDGDVDIFVCNDTTPDFLFANDGRGHFEEVGLLAGVALNASGLALGSMGADSGDYDRDGWLDLFVTDYQGEPPALYRNLGDGLWEDVATRVGADAGSFGYVKWGCGFVDFDNDGDKDIFFACGHTEDNVDLTDRRTSYVCRPILLRNTGDGRFVNVSDTSGDGLKVPIVGRGVCFDDLDNDGRVDVVILSSRRPAVVLRNESETGNHWLQLQLRGVKSNRDGVGARIKVVAGDLAQIDEVHSGRGYQSHFGSRLHFGLGPQSKVDRVEVHWPGGDVEFFENVPVDRLVVLTEGGTDSWGR